jgi:hypothetical protein
MRRQNSLSSHKFDYLAAARSLQYLSNITTDQETKHKARADANYLFAKWRKNK